MKKIGCLAALILLLCSALCQSAVPTWAVIGFADGSRVEMAPVTAPQAAALAALCPQPASNQIASNQAFPASVAGKSIALERGGVWTIKPQQLTSGFSISAYGDAGKPRPVIQVASGTALDVWDTKDIHLSDISLRSSGHDAPVIRFHGCAAVTLTRCEMTGGSYGITVEPDNRPAKPGRSTGVTLDGCDVHDNYERSGAYGSGAYFEAVDGLVLANSIFDANGFNRSGKPGPSIFNHDVYIQATCGPASVSGNLFARASSHGLQARSGGDVSGNLFFYCPIALAYGLVNGGGPGHAGGCSGTVSGNVIVGGGDIGPSNPRSIAMQFANIQSATVSGNVIANLPNGKNYYVLASVCSGISTSDSVGINSLTLIGNKLYACGLTNAPAFFVDGQLKASARGNKHRGMINQSGNAWTPAASGANLLNLLGDPVSAVRGGKSIGSLVSACHAAAGN